VLAWLGFHPQSFDRGFYLLVKAIQELRERKDGLVVTVGIGGPTGSGKTSLAEKVASVLGCVVIVSMEDYRTVAGADDGSDVDAIDFDALARNLQVRARTFLRFWGFFLEGWGLDTCRVLALMAGH
jgi:hypothetical protein